MSNNPYTWAEYVNSVIRGVLGLPSSSVGPPPQQASFSIQNPAQTARAKAAMDDDKKKPVLFSGLPGYSERGAPDDWDMSLGEVFGYRWWYLPLPPDLAGYRNSSFIYEGQVSPGPGSDNLYGANNQAWMDGRMEAKCTSHRYSSVMARSGIKHEPPETREACGCGFWAYFNKDLQVGDVLSASFGKDIPNMNSYGASIPVFGVIKGTGRVIIGEKGFRSQYAEIMGLCIPPAAVTQLSWWLHRDLYGIQKEKCSANEHQMRLSEVETMLSRVYPSARVFTHRDVLTSYFPPDSNYA
jgi:hypothetical protein